MYDSSPLRVSAASSRSRSQRRATILGDPGGRQKRSRPLAEDPRPRAHRVLENTLWLPQPIEEVFDFFSRAENLERITPDELSFHITSPRPTHMHTGATIDYALKLHGVSMQWTSEITVWDPPHRFVDMQTRGPYRVWVHEHRFTPEHGGTRVDDHVDYSLSGWVLEPLIHKLFVRPSLIRIFQYRTQAIRKLFNATGDSP